MGYVRQERIGDIKLEIREQKEVAGNNEQVQGMEIG